jgi:Bromodomain
MSPAAAAPVSWKDAMVKIVSRILAKKDAEIFAEPVPHVELGLTDYLDIVKEPMDLGTVMRKLTSNEYDTQHACATDVRRIWFNAMLYNVPGSKIYTTAKAMSESFEVSYYPLAKDDPNRPPSADDMTNWVADCHSVTSDELGTVLVRLEAACPQCLVKRPDQNEVEVNVDLVPGVVFREIRALLDTYLPDNNNTQRRKVKRVQ